jgi:hypothetical protein
MQKCRSSALPWAETADGRTSWQDSDLLAEAGHPMTSEVNQDGIVSKMDPGPNASSLAPWIEKFDTDVSRARVEVMDQQGLFCQPLKGEQ